MSALEMYRRLGAAARLDDEAARVIVDQAMPHAMATLGRTDRLPVKARRVEAAHARGGSLIPAWPMRQSDGSVCIEYVDDWGAMLATWLKLLDPSYPDDAEDLTRQRLWIGIANDVIQLFVPDPPAGTYSMVRHHALMLASATAWLGPTARLAWFARHARAAAAFVQRHDHDALWPAIEAAERGLAALLGDPRARQSASLVLVWLESDSPATALYVEYLGAASLGVAALLEAMPDSDGQVAAWLTDAVINLHQDASFNRDWMAKTARHLAAVGAL